MKLYRIQPSNEYPPIVLADTQHWPSLSARINKSRFGTDWKRLDFVFDETAHRVARIPDLCTAYISGILTFRAEISDALFPVVPPRLEFLPISVAGASWILLNCLETSKHYTASSIFLRGLDNQIYFTQHLEFPADRVPEAELFTLEDSNKAELFSLGEFKERIVQNSLKGISFGEVGRLGDEAACS